MPVVGLPPAVEIMMAQMLDQNGLTSHRITVGKHYAGFPRYREIGKR